MISYRTEELLTVPEDRRSMFIEDYLLRADGVDTPEATRHDAELAEAQFAISSMKTQIDHKTDRYWLIGELFSDTDALGFFLSLAGRETTNHLPITDGSVVDESRWVSGLLKTGLVEESASGVYLTADGKKLIDSLNITNS